MDRIRIDSGTPWEAAVGYSRAVRTGQHIFVSGTTASDSDGQVVAIGDAFAQTQFVLAKITQALADVGGKTSDVVRTRIFVTDIRQWEEIGRAHSEVFHSIRPTATMVQVSALVNPQHLVEIEVDAIVTD